MRLVLSVRWGKDYATGMQVLKYRVVEHSAVCGVIVDATVARQRCVTKGDCLAITVLASVVAKTRPVVGVAWHAREPRDSCR